MQHDQQKRENLTRRATPGSVKEIIESERALVAYGNTKSVDSYNEVLLPSGWVFDRFAKNPVMPWSHDYRMPPVGRAMWWKTDSTGLLFKGQFSNTQFAEEIWQLYKGGFLNAFSVGYWQLEYVSPSDEEKYMQLLEEHNIKGRPRLIGTKQELWEISPVVLPANADSLVTGVEEVGVKSKAFFQTIEQLCQDEHFCKDIGHTKDLLIRIVEQHKEPEKTQVQVNYDFKSSESEKLDMIQDQLDELKEVILAFQTRLQKVENQIKNFPPQEDNQNNSVGSSVEIVRAYIEQRLPQIVDGELSRLTGKSKS